MVTQEQIDEQTREEWRELGFFYDQDETARYWRLIGSREGLAKFPALLTEYVSDERNASLSEHEHYGPYWYLKIVTWNQPEIGKDDIRGTLDDLRRLAEIAKRNLENVEPGDTFEIDEEFAPNNEFSLRFEVQEDDFDPASPDPLRYPSDNDDRSLLSRLRDKLRAR